MEPDRRLVTAAFVVLTISDLAYFTASGLLLGVTPFFVTGPLGSDTAGVGLALGAFSVTTLVLRPVAGRWWAGWPTGRVVGGCCWPEQACSRC